MITFQCHVCRTHLNAEDAQAGGMVRCPNCLTALHVPQQAPGESIAQLPPGMAPSGKRYGFNCPYCASRLEAGESMAAQEGQCPTCGSTITIPILDRYGRLIDPKTRKIVKPPPHPVHAYAAAGARAPTIIRDDKGTQRIRCPRCSADSPITANNCRSCGMPFTMEGATSHSSDSANGFCVAALVLGILSIPGFCTIILPALAIIFAIVGLNQIKQSGNVRGGRGMAIAGLVCGLIGAFIEASLWLR